MPPKHILFLCTGNSARSIIAEAILNFEGRESLRAFSAGSHPAGKVNPYAIETLLNAGIPVTGLRSKSWDEYTRPATPHMDIIITVCGNAAGEVCPVWPGHPTTAHWGFDDPAAVTGSDEQKRTAFQNTFELIRARVGKYLIDGIL